VQRRRLVLRDAELERAQAAKLLEDSAGTLERFPLNAPGSLRRRRGYLRLHFDTLAANQELVEENFYQGAVRDAHGLLDGVTQMFLQHLEPWLGSELVKEVDAATGIDLPSRFRSCAVRRYFFLGCVLARLYVSSPDEALLERALQSFTLARGANRDTDSRIDLELGQLFLDSALKGTGDGLALYERAMSSFERALAADQPALRAEGLRVLLSAYRQRPVIERQQRRLRERKT